MQLVRLGSTGIVAARNGFGCLPIQRDSREGAVALLRRARAAGFNFFDTARAYTDSEEKTGEALCGAGAALEAAGVAGPDSSVAMGRAGIFIATKTAAENAEDFWRDLETSLRLLKTDYIDIYQFHNPAFCPKPGDGSGLYEAALEAKKQGRIRHIGITNHRLGVAREAIESGLYETLQFPFSYLASDKDIELVRACRAHNMGFIAMKSLSGGLIRNAAAAYAFAAQFDNVLPIWGIQREAELDEFIALQKNPPELNSELRAVIDRDRAELSGSFCRGCGYCMPCPQGIEINNCARMSLMLRRAPSASWLDKEWQDKMAKIPTCLHCNKCKSKCPYGLDTPELLAANYADYVEVLAGRRSVQ